MYNGFWFSPERRALQAAIDETQQFVSGTVRLKLYKVRQDLLHKNNRLLGKVGEIGRTTCCLGWVSCIFFKSETLLPTNLPANSRPIALLTAYYETTLVSFLS